MKLFFLTIILFTAASCRYFSKEEEKEEPIARVYDKFLYRSDLEGVGKGAARPEDSIQAVRNYIDSWIRHNVVLRYAQDNLPDEEQRLNDQLRDYKESLLIYLYEKELLHDKLDTLVTLPQIEQYYSDHQDIFQLKEEITKLKYIMLRMDTKVQLDSVRQWMRNSNGYNYPKLRGFCNDYAVKYSISDSNWYNMGELGALLPLRKFNLDNARSNKSYLEVADSGYGYLLKFDDYRIKGSGAPLDFVSDDIRNIIINKRKLAFIAGIHKSIYEEALKHNDFEVLIDSDEQVKSK
jgi:hypothetical protein